jgi:hypothetical protein
MSWVKQHVGLDWFDIGVHLTLSGIIMGMLDETGAGDLAVMAAAGASVLVLALRRTWALRHSRRAGTAGLDSGEMVAVRLEEMEQRIAQLEATEARVAELEERLDFAERYLAQPVSDPVAALGRGRAEEPRR